MEIRFGPDSVPAPGAETRLAGATIACLQEWRA